MNESCSDQQSGIKRFRLIPQFTFVELLVVLLLIVVLGSLLLYGVKYAREEARRSQCAGHFCQLALALHNYHREFSCFPPAYTTDAEGRPIHSWRVLILPWLSQEEVFAKYEFSKRWNDPKNLKLTDQINLDQFHCPTESDHERSLMTNYVVVVGDRTAFPGHRSTALTDITDGAENKILLVEIGNSDIHWMEPRDLNFAKMSFVVNDPHRASISSRHPRGPGVLFANGSNTIRLAESLRPENLQDLITIPGQEPVLKQSLILPNAGSSGWQLGEDSIRPDK